jgi:hypothetical protein
MRRRLHAAYVAMVALLVLSPGQVEAAFPGSKQEHRRQIP